MGGLSGILGTAGGASGSGYAAPTTANVQSGTDQGQLGSAYTGSQGALSSQQALLQALQNQRALANQSNVYQQQQGLASQLAGNAGTGYQANALGQQAALNNQLNASNGAQNLNGALASQQALAQQQQGTLQQYQNLANGVGPNPAQAALNQNTAQNVANQSALMAGQRGASANPGLIARQAAQQGAATQQQAVGQGATLQAQQQLAGLSGLTGQQQAIGNTNTNVGNLANQQIANLQGGINAQQQAASNSIAQTQASQNALANQANALASQQIGQTNTGAQSQLGEQQLLQNALSGQNTANVSSQNNVNSGNAGLTNTSLQGQQGIFGGVVNSLAGGLSSVFAQGGEVKKPRMFADGGDSSNPYAGDAVAPVVAPTVPAIQATGSGPQSSFGKFINGATNAIAPSDDDDSTPAPPANPGADALKKGFGSFAVPVGKILKGMSSGSGSGGSASGGATPLTTAAADDAGAGASGAGGLSGLIAEAGPAAALAAKGGMIKKQDYRSGGHVKAASSKQKAVKAGNSYDNDKVPAMLSEGEVVIPRSIMQGKDPARGAMDFVAKVLAKRRRA